MITLTDRAARHLREARERGDLRHQDLRVIARRGPGGELEYALHWVEPGQALPSDLFSELGPLRLHIEIHSAAFLAGATLDYVVDPGAAGFRLEPAPAEPPPARRSPS